MGLDSDNLAEERGKSTGIAVFSIFKQAKVYSTTGIQFGSLYVVNWVQVTYTLLEHYAKLRDRWVIQLACTKVGEPGELATSRWAQKCQLNQATKLMPHHNCF